MAALAFLWTEKFLECMLPNGMMEAVKKPPAKERFQCGFPHQLLFPLRRKITLRRLSESFRKRPEAQHFYLP